MFRLGVLMLVLLLFSGCTDSLTGGGNTYFFPRTTDTNTADLNVSVADLNEAFVRKPLETLPLNETWKMQGNDAGVIYDAILVTPSDNTYGERLVDLSGNESIIMPIAVRTPYQMQYKQTPFFGFATQTIWNSTAPIATYTWKAGSGQQFEVLLGGNNAGFSTTNAKLSFSSAMGIALSTPVGYSTEIKTPYVLFRHPTNNTPFTMQLYRSGTTAPVSGNRIADINFMGYGGAVPADFRTGAIIRTVADGIWSATAYDNPTRIEFYTQCDGGTDCMKFPAMDINSDGDVNINRLVLGGDTNYNMYDADKLLLTCGINSGGNSVVCYPDLD